MALKQALQDRLPVVHMYDVEIGPVVAAHVGPGCVTVAVVPLSATRPVA
jgi:fatty acid-binding protein DegV